MSSKRPWTIVLVATFAMTIGYLDRQALAALGPDISAELHLTDADYGWLNAAFSIAYLIGGPLAGRWIDVFGARRGLPLAIVAWSLAAAAHAFAPDFASFFVLRALLGFAEAPMLPAGAQTVQLMLPAASRARGMAWLFAGMSVGSALAPILAIRIAGSLGSWRASFAVVATIAIAWLPLWFAVTARRALPEPAVGVETECVPWQRLLATPAMRRGIVGLVAIIPASTIALAWGAKFFKARHFEPNDYATYLMISGFAYDLGAIGFGDLASRRSARRGDNSPARALLLAAALLSAAGLCGMAFVPGTAVVACVIVLSIGRGAYTAVVNADTLARVPGGAIATAAGLIASAQSLVILIVSPIIGASIDASGYTPILVGLAVFVLPGCLAWMAWRPPASTSPSA